MTTAFLPGFLLSFSLILAIGAQNAMVLRQGLRREHVFAVCATCAVSDAILIAAGVAGSGALAARLPWFEPVMRYGGAAFLVAYGVMSFRNAWQGGHGLQAAEAPKIPLAQTLSTLLALTWLNPHVYLDTVVLLGSVSAQYDNRLAFGFGAVCASFLFFFALGYGARALAPIFARPTAWRVLDLIVGLTMWALAAKLVVM